MAQRSYGLEGPTVSWVLRFGIVLYCLGAARFFLSYRTPIGGFLFTYPGISDAFIVTLEHTIGYGCLAAAVITLWRPDRVVLLAVAALAWLWAWAIWYIDDDRAAPYAVVSEAARYVAPLALLLLLPRRDGAAHTPARLSLVEWLLRGAAASTFFGHGIIALQDNPGFANLITASARRLLDLQLSDYQTMVMLKVIGAVDVVVAVLVLLLRRRTIALHMAVWGLVTALSRVTYGDLVMFHDVLLRSANGGLPLVLYLLWRHDATLHAARAESTRLGLNLGHQT